MTADVAGLRIAIVNWRDPWHPAAGGAERYAWELARRLSARGARVHYVTSRPRCRRRRDSVEGVTFVRRGGRFTVYPRVLAWLLLHRRGFDAVVDCQNGIPFFTPWVVRAPVLCVIFHVHDEQFDLYFPWWLARFGRWLEGPVMRWSYRRHACVAISPSSARALRERLRWTGPVYFVPVGVELQKDSHNGGNHLVCVTRLVPHKRVPLLLAAAEALPDVHLDIVGGGPDLEKIRAEAGERVTVHGYVQEETKRDLLARATLHLSASRGEGWGLSVMEAAALGIPTVAFEVDGLRDAVRDGQTGWLVHEGERLEDVVRRALKELADEETRATMAAACRAWAARFDWDSATDTLAELIAGDRQRGATWPH